MSRYAENTSVSVERSKAEIEKILARYGAAQFLSGWDQLRAMIGFSMGGRQVRFVLDLPDRNDDEFKLTPAGRRRRSSDQQLSAWEQACRQRWRALALVVKAKLEAVEAGITTFDEEFLAHIVLPSGQSVGQFMVPQIQAAYEHGQMPKLLPHIRK